MPPPPSRPPRPSASSPREKDTTFEEAEQRETQKSNSGELLVASDGSNHPPTPHAVAVIAGEPRHADADGFKVPAFRPRPKPLQAGKLLPSGDLPGDKQHATSRKEPSLTETARISDLSRPEANGTAGKGGSRDSLPETAEASETSGASSLVTHPTGATCHQRRLRVSQTLLVDTTLMRT